MSIYLEFPPIALYPVYNEVAVQTEQPSAFTEEDIMVLLRQEQLLLQDFLRLMTV